MNDRVSQASNKRKTQTASRYFKQEVSSIAASIIIRSKPKGLRERGSTHNTDQSVATTIWFQTKHEIRCLHNRIRTASRSGSERGAVNMQNLTDLEAPFWIFQFVNRSTNGFPTKDNFISVSKNLFLPDAGLIDYRSVDLALRSLLELCWTMRTAKFLFKDYLSK